MKTKNVVPGNEITLRDFLAGQVVSGCCFSQFWQGSDERLAGYAYAVADAMIKARDKDRENPVSK